jgi:hypothetical protein
VKVVIPRPSSDGQPLPGVGKVSGWEIMFNTVVATNFVIYHMLWNFLVVVLVKTLLLLYFFPDEAISTQRNLE